MRCDLSEYRAALALVPSITGPEAKRAAAALKRGLEAGQRAARSARATTPTRRGPSSLLCHLALIASDEMGRRNVANS